MRVEIEFLVDDEDTMNEIVEEIRELLEQEPLVYAVDISTEEEEGEE